MHFGDHQQVVGCNGPVIRKCHKVVILWEKNILAVNIFSNNYLSGYSSFLLLFKINKNSAWLFVFTQLQINMIIYFHHIKGIKICEKVNYKFNALFNT